MDNELEDAIGEFAAVVRRELSYLGGWFQRRPLSRFQDGGATSYERAYTLWCRTTSYPDVLSGIFLLSRERNNEWLLRELALGQERFQEVEQDGRLAGLTERLTGSGSREQPRLMQWMLFREFDALVRPEFQLDGRSLPTRPSGYLILELDWDYIQEHVLPGIAEHTFGGRSIEETYEVAVVVRAAPVDYSVPRFLYRSQPAIGDEWLANAGCRRRFWFPSQTLLARYRNRLRDAASDLPTGGADVRSSGSARTARTGLSRLGKGPVWPRVLLAGSGPALAVDLVGSIEPGILSRAVALEQSRSRVAGLGVLAVLACAVGALVVSTRRTRRLSEMHSRLMTGVTHELRTPLAVIRSAADNLADGIVSSDQRVMTYGELVRKQGVVLGEMVEQMLQFAALNSGDRPFRTGPLDVREVVAKVLERLQPLISQSGFIVEQDSDKSVPPTRADELAVEQILMNLVSNAIKYGSPGCWMRIETSLDESGPKPRVRVSVHDRGMGIPKHEAGRVFDPYFRGCGASETGKRGAGLGLKIARDLAVRMGGTLYLESEQGKGSVFTLSLPVDRAA